VSFFFLKVFRSLGELKVFSFLFLIAVPLKPEAKPKIENVDVCWLKVGDYRVPARRLSEKLTGECKREWKRG
jgi:hypothetical protein